MNSESALALFFEEAFEQSNLLESLLLSLDEQPESNAEDLSAMFRSAHTIKGSAGLFALDGLIAFTHVMENVLDRLRNGELAIDKPLVALLLACNDHLQQMLVHYRNAPSEPFPEDAEHRRLLAALEEHTQFEHSGASTPPAAAPESTACGTWHLFLRYHPDLFRHGFDPASFLRYLGKLGEIVHIHTRLETPDTLLELDPTTCRLSNELAFRSPATAAEIASAFEFIQDESEIDILPPASGYDVFAALAARYGGSAESHLARWQEAGYLPANTPQPTAPQVQVPTSESTAKPSAVPEKRRGADRVEGSRFIRIEAAKLDALINRVGELVISAASSRMRAKETDDSDMIQAVEVLSQLVEGIRDDALNLRMVPISEIFNRFPRMVHDVSGRLGKEIELDLVGADTEIDKSMIEKLTDPLMHIVRNAIDHGIEDAASRIAQGKPARGLLRLKAYHDTGAIVVDVSDDGRGMNKAAILAKAQERGLLPEGRQLSDQEIYKLIFLPGFSTAEQVSDISGRGVGMDVVRRNIDALRGEIEVLSKPGLGSTLRIRLPLTLAIIDGFHVEVAGSSLVLPLDMMAECMDMPTEQISRETRQIWLRDAWIPYVSLRELFALPPCDGPEYVVVAQFGQTTAGIIVDRLIGDIQAVIKPLGSLFRSLRGVSGSTIMGNGRLALILDIPQLIQLALNREHRLVEQRQAELTEHGITPTHPETRATQPLTPWRSS
ncbi:chemotaxis protein CheA [Dechloromonas sp. ARDL1]|uniref:chemotaxis protein CheA n=1 Tax=Dechloromonas sp. ARDL1 TaxID=3322121 RepID=UPI003DA6EFAF